MKQILYIAIGIFLGVMALFIVWSIHNMIMQTNTNTANITTLINNAKLVK